MKAVKPPPSVLLPFPAALPVLPPQIALRAQGRFKERPGLVLAHDEGSHPRLRRKRIRRRVRVVAIVSHHPSPPPPLKGVPACPRHGYMSTLRATTGMGSLLQSPRSPLRGGRGGHDDGGLDAPPHRFDHPEEEAETLCIFVGCKDDLRGTRHVGIAAGEEGGGGRREEKRRKGGRRGGDGKEGSGGGGGGGGGIYKEWDLLVPNNLKTSTNRGPLDRRIQLYA